MDKFVVTTTRFPTAYSTPECFVVEARTEDDAVELVRHSLRDFSGRAVFKYEVKPFTLPPEGRIISHGRSA
jgi:hypothetical protein